MSTDVRDGMESEILKSHSDLNDYQANRLFQSILFLHMLLWVIVPILTQPNAPLDSLEMLTWGHEWQLGYYKHPPFPAWAAEAASQLFGNTVWPTYLLSQLTTAACFWAVFRIGKDAIGNRGALLAVLLLEACYYYNFTTPEFNNNVTSRGFCALAVLFLHQGLTRRHLFYWALSGVSLGLGMLSKYDTAIFALAMIAFAVWHPRGRSAWRTAGPYVLLVTALLCFLPHLYWLVKNDFPTIHYFLRRSSHESQWWTRLVNPFKFAVSQLGALLPILLVATSLTGLRWRRAHVENSEHRFHQDFLLWFGVVPFVLVLIAGISTGAQIRSMWGTALWTFTGLALLSNVQIDLSLPKARRMARISLSLGAIFVVALVVRNTVLPSFREKGSRVHFPGQALAAQVRDIYAKEFGESPRIIGGPWWEAANVAMYGGDRASVFMDLDQEKTPWASDTLISEVGGVIIWEETSANADYAGLLAKRFPTARTSCRIILPWGNSAKLKPLQFLVAVVPPRSSARQRLQLAHPQQYNSSSIR